MARYDRAFLKPYIKSIFASELAVMRIGEQIRQYEERIQYLKAGPRLRYPQLAQHEDESGEGCLFMWVPWLGVTYVVIMFLWGIGCLCQSIEWGEMDEAGLGIIALFLNTLIFGWPSVHAIRKDRKNRETARRMNEQKDFEYSLAVEQYEQAWREEYVLIQKELEQLEPQLQRWRERYKKANDVRAALYDANVIPRRYRDLYAAAYLFDWFIFSEEDDLTVALNLYLLEQIKERLDELIRIKKEELINERIIIANQRQSMEQAERYHREMVDKLEKMHASDQERNAYLRMMEADMEADAFFTAANYFKK